MYRDTFNQFISHCVLFFFVLFYIIFIKKLDEDILKKARIFEKINQLLIICKYKSLR